MSERLSTGANSDKLTQEAAFWFMRLNDEDCTNEERATFQRWLEQDPSHEREYREMLEIWDISGNLPKIRHSTALSDARPLPAQRHLGRTPRYRLVAIAAVLALFLCGLFARHEGWIPTSYRNYQAGAEIRAVTLADGSQVQLNLDTALVSLAFRDHRRVTLHRGEVFFDVRPDATRPFEVRAGNGRIVVTGTQFNVWKYGDQVAVSVAEGSVKVVNADRSGDTSTIFLTRGQQARYGGTEPSIRVAWIDPQQILAWRVGKLILDDMQLSEALPLINRYLDRPVRLADAATGALHIGGIYNTNDIEELVQTLPSALPVKLSVDDDGSILIARR